MFYISICPHTTHSFTKLTFASLCPPTRKSKDTPASASENQIHHTGGREGELGHPLPGESGFRVLAFTLHLQYQEKKSGQYKVLLCGFCLFVYCLTA